MLDIGQIKRILPHRPPMLLIDRAEVIEPGKKVSAYKNVTINDEFFKGHFPEKPIMPGMLIVEAMAQAAILIYHTAYEADLKKVPDYYLGSVKARFLHPVFPGDQLRIEAEADKVLTTGAFVSAKAYVGDKQVASAELVFVVHPVR